MSWLKEARKQWNNFAVKRMNNIDRLLTQKVDDYILLEEQPLPIIIGSKTIYIGCFNFANEHKFFHQWATILSALASKIINMQLSDERRKELVENCRFDLLSNGKYMLEFLWTDKWLFKQICKLIKKTLLKQEQYILNQDGNSWRLLKWKNCSYGYFKKHVTKEKLIQICWLIYLYNFDAQKKSLKMLVEVLGIKQLEETYIPFWLQNLGGLTGKFYEPDQADIDAVFNDKENSESTQTKVEESDNG